MKSKVLAFLSKFGYYIFAFLIDHAEISVLLLIIVGMFFVFK